MSQAQVIFAARRAGLTTYRAALLAVLAERREMTGHQIEAYFDHAGTPRSSIVACLYHLRKKGLVDGFWTNSEDGRACLGFRLTQIGTIRAGMLASQGAA